MMSPAVAAAHRRYYANGLRNSAVRLLRARLSAVKPHVPLVGRDGDVAAVMDRLRRHGRCSVVGPGGVGKTALARVIVDSWPTATAWVSAESVEDVMSLASSITTALDSEILPGEGPQDAACMALDGRRVLAVLDGVEHIVDLDLLVNGMPTTPDGPWLLVTSRRSSSGPPVWRVSPLPGDVGAAKKHSTGTAPSNPSRDLLDQLLDAHGKLGVFPPAAMQRSLELTGGLPLAIELLAKRLVAGGQLEFEHPDEPPAGPLVERRSTDLELTVMASVARSLRLVDETAREVFRRLAFTVAPFGIDHAVGMTAATPEVTRAALAQLLDVGLVFDAQRGFDLLPPIRRAALDLLRESGSFDTTLDDALGWADRLIRASEGDPDAARTVAANLENLLYLGWVATTSGHRGALGYAVALFEPFHRRMRNIEILTLCQHALRLPDPAAVVEAEAARCAALASAACASAPIAHAMLRRADSASARAGEPPETMCRIESTRALLAIDAGDLPEARRAAGRSIEFADRSPDAADHRWVATHELALVALEEGDLDRCEELATACVEWGRSNDLGLAHAGAVELAWAALERGRWADAAARARQLRTDILGSVGQDTEISVETRAIELAAEPVFDGTFPEDHRDHAWWLRLTVRTARAAAAPIDEHWESVLRTAADVVVLADSLPLVYPGVVAQILVGDAALAGGEIRQAQQAYERALGAAVRHGFRLRAADALDGYAALASAIGDHGVAGSATGVANEVRVWCGAHPWPRPSLPERNPVGAAPPAGWLDAGLPTPTAVEAIAGVLSARTTAPPGANPIWSQLTKTEREVARLAADGASNNTIATSLFVSRRTVESHLQRIYRKLDVHSRTQLANVLRGSAIGPLRHPTDRV